MPELTETTQKKRKHTGGHKKPIALEVFTQTAERYLNQCKQDKQVPFLIGFAEELGIDESTLRQVYENKYQYAPTLKKIRQASERGLLNKGLNENKPVFPIFLLKAKYGYVETQKVDVNLRGQGVVQLPAKKPKVRV